MTDPYIAQPYAAQPPVSSSANDGTTSYGNLDLLAAAAASHVSAAGPSTPQTAGNMPRHLHPSLLNPTWGSWSAHSAQIYRDYDMYRYQTATVVQQQPPLNMAQPTGPSPLPIGQIPPNMGYPAISQHQIATAQDSNVPTGLTFNMALSSHFGTPIVTQAYAMGAPANAFSLPQNPRRMLRKDAGPIPSYPQFEVEQDTPYPNNFEKPRSPSTSSETDSNLDAEADAEEMRRDAYNQLYQESPGELTRVVTKIMQKHNLIPDQPQARLPVPKAPVTRIQGFKCIYLAIKNYG